MTQNRKDLGYLGESFQYRLAHEFITNHTFFEDLSPIIDQNMFTDPNLKTFVGVLRNYYEKEGCVPSFDMTGIELNNISHSDRESETYAAVLDKVMNTQVDGSDRIREFAEKFFRQQNIIKTANEILKIAGNGDTEKYDACVGLLNDAMTKGMHNDFGEGVFDHLSETLSDDYRTAIPTGIEGIDNVLEGGLGKGELGVIIGPSGFGKSQPLDSRILTPNGFKLMGEMCVGDFVIGSDGKAHVVSGVFPQGKRPIYKVTFSNGTSCECDIEHLWNVNSLYQRCGKKYVPGVSKNRDDKKYVPDHSFKTLTLREILDKGLVKNGSSRYNFKVPVAKPVEFNEQETKFDPYFVGYYIGDGSYKKAEITVGKSDYASVYPILSNIIKEDLHTFFREKRNIWQFDIIGKTKSLLKESFNPECKSPDKEIPSEYVFNSLENRIALLQGLMDSDGHANKNGSCEFCSKSRKLAEQVQFIVRSLGGFASLTESDSSYYNKKYGKKIACGKRYRVTISMCDRTIPLFRLDRKQERVKYRTKLSDGLFIVSADYVGEKEAQCIMVDSDEHLYLTEDFIVTHNTSLTTAMASHAALKNFKVLQIFFEDRVKQIQRKHIGRLTDVEAKDLSKPDMVERVKKKLDDLDEESKRRIKENLRMIRFPSGEKTARQIGNFIKKLTNSGFKPDLVIVDYFECLAHENDRSTTSEWEREGKTMRKFEAMAGELDIAIWIPSQGTKDSVNAEVVTMEKAGGSFKKMQIAHIIMSIARTIEDINENKATIAILKNRAGKSGAVFHDVNFNNGTCKISTENADVVESMYEENENREKSKNELIKKLIEINKEH